MKNKSNKTQQTTDDLQKLKKTLQKALKKCTQYDTIRQKIQLSKPILLTIQTKIKKRQKLLHNQIKKQSEEKTKAQALTQQYMKLHQLGVKILQKNGLLNNYQGLDNFASKSTKVSKDQLDSMNRDVKRYMNLSESNNYLTNRMISERRQSPIIIQQFPHNKNAYDILQQKLNKERQINNNNDQNPQFKNRFEQMSLKMRKDIEHIKQLKMRLKKQNSKNNINHKFQVNNKNSNKVIKMTTNNKQIVSQKQQTITIQQKRSLVDVNNFNKFIQKKKNKLSSLRQQGRSQQSLALINLRRAAFQLN